MYFYRFATQQFLKYSKLANTIMESRFGSKLCCSMQMPTIVWYSIGLFVHVQLIFFNGLINHDMLSADLNNKQYQSSGIIF